MNVSAVPLVEGKHLHSVKWQTKDSLDVKKTSDKHGHRTLKPREQNERGKVDP